MNRYALSYWADHDLDDITDYILKIWREIQTRDYLAGLVECFRALADKPNLGRSAAEYAHLLKRYNYKAHTIFYEPTEKGIFVVRILGQRQDFERHL
tara:strand:- start:701 stop:991 length:291 start_codon:yes stop_codon:yes gene_type:complete